MTVSYAGEVPNGSSFGCFWKILWKWRGSLYKLIWRELLAYLALYYTINVMYRYVLNEEQKRIFEKIRQYFGAQSESIPMSFVLGFYVTLIVKRWWDQYKLLPWPDTLALFISAAIPGNNETGRLMRRNIMRYSVLAYVITLMRISLRVKRRFPTWQHLVDAGLMLESEKKIFEIMDSKSPMSKYWMPLVWATNIINRARKQEIIASDHIVQTLLVELSDIRRRLGALIGYDTVCVPLVYTQVVTLVLYTYFIAALLGRQMIPRLDGAVPTGKYEDPDLYFPLFTALQFCFYVGWLKVAEVLINPFGEDDDDIELNWLIDRHIKASYMIVDEMHEEHPELLKDQYWEEVVPTELPYTVASEHYRRYEPKGSAETYKVKTSDAMYANIIPSKRQNFDDMYADYESVDTPMAERRKSSNWFSRQITRMGSLRSSSTAYSSGYPFKRNRHNSVYSSPDNDLPGQQLRPSINNKMKMYDKFPRKSGRNLKNMLKRARIPTPDATTSNSNEKDNRFNLAPVEMINETMTSSGHLGAPMSMTTGVALIPANLPDLPNPNATPVTLFLSPIKESDSNSAHSTLQAGTPATNALADWRNTLNNSPSLARILPTESTATTASMIKVVTVLPGTHSSPPIPNLNTHPLSTGPIITEVPVDDRQDGSSDFNDNDSNIMRTVNRTNSVASNKATRLTRQLSFGAKSTESPSLPKRNQPITSSAPSTLTKKGLEEDEKKEIYV
ncbi:bestrophin-4 [Sitodiplosis mosellana]|uniref:bestrophin-4 n=1 Tax=Sitodiplosis mosellana TaxID=263140 RepID=UPI002444AF9A|nr:bestrophin-4 [Sitodiplosis mosellana]XP_055321352.1 bestrophin-4 [Sitodiplosis mosellana]XP_055321353.1 bestrophin-4 [Sitodiplosis mosellana]XP_055321354.1 bestrophin-4 [Sitodiplosis mosellana]XP_055321355.1 bestrophin-4 [Sitodiplosis mosellana]